LTKLISYVTLKKFNLHCILFVAALFKLFEPLIGKKSIQYKNGPKARQLRQEMDRSFSHEAVMNYYDCFLEVC
jgi:hypothetical protein